MYVCVCASSLLLQVYLCPLYPFLLFHLSSWLLPPEQPMLHFSWIILSIPVLGSGWLLLIASPLPSISLASFWFNTFFFTKEAAACAVWFYPLIPVTLPTRTLSSFFYAAAPSPCFMLSSFENFLLRRRIWYGYNWQTSHYALPCAAT